MKSPQWLNISVGAFNLTQTPLEYKERTAAKSMSEAGKTLVSKSDRDNSRERNYRTVVSTYDQK